MTDEKPTFVIAAADNTFDGGRELLDDGLYDDEARQRAVERGRYAVIGWIRGETEHAINGTDDLSEVAELICDLIERARNLVADGHIEFVLRKGLRPEDHNEVREAIEEYVKAANGAAGPGAPTWH